MIVLVVLRVAQFTDEQLIRGVTDAEWLRLCKEKERKQADYKGNEDWYKLDAPKPLALATHREHVANVNATTTIEPIVPEHRRLK